MKIEENLAETIYDAHYRPLILLSLQNKEKKNLKEEE
jgi:hypothetical protein